MPEDAFTMMCRIFTSVVLGAIVFAVFPDLSGDELTVREKFLLGLTGLVVTYSQVGYLRSVLARRYRLAGRLFLDLGILFLFYQLLSNPGNRSEYVIAFAFVFVLYVSWDLVKMYEYRDLSNQERSAIHARFFPTWLCALAAMLVAVPVFLGSAQVADFESVEWVAALAQVALAVLFLFAKSPPTQAPHEYREPAIQA